MRKAMLALGLLVCLGAAAADWTYHNDFQDAALGKPAEKLMYQGDPNRAWVVKEEGANRFLEASPYPTDSAGVLFGPEQSLAAGARIRADATGKRMPEFGVGVGGPSGPRLLVMPAVGQIQLVQAEDVKLARMAYAWKPGTWTNLRVEASQEAGKWIVRGKAWADGEKEPDWMIQAQTPEKPPGGKAFAFGMPFSDKPFDFDDLMAR